MTQPTELSEAAVSTDDRPENRAEATSVSIDICYPDGRMKSVEWGTSWLAETAALILSESVMDAAQKDKFRGKRRGLRKRTWKDRPTMIRKLTDGRIEPVCSLGEIPSSSLPSEGSGKCESGSDVRGVLLKVTFRVQHKDRNCTVVLERESLAETAILLLHPDQMTPAERSQFDQKVDAIAVRRLVVSQVDPILIGCGAVGGSVTTNSNNKFFTAKCGIGSAINTWK